MSLIPRDEALPHIVIENRKDALNNLKQFIPDDAKIKVSDGEVWANKALLSTSSEYFSAMLDGDKFKEGQEGVGSLEMYNKEVVSIVINYFYSGEISCKDLSLSSLLYLEDLLRLILLLPQSAKIKDFTKKKISLKKFSIPECLLGLVTADDLRLDIAADILQFINYNPGIVVLKKDRSDAGKCVASVKSTSPVEMFEKIYKNIKIRDEETQMKILSSLDTSSFTKEELLDLVRNEIEEVKKSLQDTIIIYKDTIVCRDRGIKVKGSSIFIPQHWNKLE